MVAAVNGGGRMAGVGRSRRWLWVAFALVVALVASELVEIPPLSLAVAGAAQKAVDPAAIGSDALEAADRSLPSTLDVSKVPAGAKGLTPEKLSRYAPPTASDGDTKVLGGADPTPVQELVGERTADSETWVNADGSRSLKMFDEPKYFQRFGSAEWVAIDSSLVPDDAHPGWVRNGANSWSESPWVSWRLGLLDFDQLVAG